MSDLDGIFLSYEKILYRFKIMNIKTKSEKVKSNNYYILYEGYLWLLHVYFQAEKTLLDADIEFFELRIKQYEELLKVEHKNYWIKDDMEIKELERFFNRTDSSIRKAIWKMCDADFYNYKYLISDKVVISKEGCQWICKNFLKPKYLKLL